ncbi:alpha-hydroxyketone-type quorum-sensing autoinducer synthase [Streptomyces sp. DSM 40750]|uniref:alpha-hydroxyketone-type quorum-sensing autoinducer synthase n=1 Tax=Streptomyces sp. DSM 40750 TaxID=2801030 RepID=UPI00214C94EA|nr:alpha-hydroxyketone-type quorum-sensing autoinducer synthase [Streptomyces sp. DSM 40750]UUU18876.1 quorum-sensing autoinducer CAI-1 synthase [Streptomyces sp. DSM 40750]UUU27782.1 quorum-sensing autoinducer CAI-1 synthase [Streptomyces sp. DSM 40750]
MIEPCAVGSLLPAFVQERVEAFHASGIRGRWAGRHILRGRRLPGPGSTVVDSNDYLRLAGDKRIVDAVTESLDAMRGARLASAALLYEEHPQTVLERELAGYLGSQAGVFCQSGYDANVGLLQTLAGPEVPVYVDMLAHMSLWAGAKAAGAPVRPFRHNDTAHLLRRIEEHGPGVIAVDSMYSVCGSLAPLAALCAVAEQTGCVLVVDEAHSLGTHGPAGAGMVAAAGLTKRVHFRTMSLSKAFAKRAGYITCPDEEFVEYFKMTSYPAVFASTLVPSDLVQISATLDVVRHDEWRRTRLQEVAATLRQGLTSLGYDLRGSGAHIMSLPTGPDETIIQVRDIMEDHDVFGSVFCPPATPHNRTALRLSLHCDLTDQDVDRIIQASGIVRPLITSPRSLTP